MLETLGQLILAIAIAAVVIAVIVPPCRRAIDNVSRVPKARRRR
jgi:hypothetical protein